MFVTVLSWIQLFMRFLLFVVSSYNLLHAPPQLNTAHWRVHKNRVNVAWWLCSVGLIIASIGRIIDPTNVVGTSAVVTVGTALGMSFMFVGWAG